MTAALFLAPPVLMGMTAAAAAIAAIYVTTRPVVTEQGVYARRLVGTMLAALALILGIFCVALLSCDGAGCRRSPPASPLMPPPFPPFPLPRLTLPAHRKDAALG